MAFVNQITWLPIPKERNVDKFHPFSKIFSVLARSGNLLGFPASKKIKNSHSVTFLKLNNLYSLIWSHLALVFYHPRNEKELSLTTLFLKSLDCPQRPTTSLPLVESIKNLPKYIIR